MRRKYTTPTLTPPEPLQWEKIGTTMLIRMVDKPEVILGPNEPGYDEAVKTAKGFRHA